MNLCPRDLAELTGGRAAIGQPCRRCDGELAPIGRHCAIRRGGTSEGDVFWCLLAARAMSNWRFCAVRWASSLPGLPIEPWPGRFSLQVDDPLAALARLVERLSALLQRTIFGSKPRN